MHGVHQTGYVHGIVASGRHEVTLGLYSGKRKQIPDELFFRLVLHMELTRDLYMDTGTILKHMIVVMNVSQRHALVKTQPQARRTVVAAESLERTMDGH